MLKNFFTTIRDWLYPPVCVTCRVLMPIDSNGAPFLCGICREMLEPLKLSGNVCTKCGVPVSEGSEKCRRCAAGAMYFSSNRAVFLYYGMVRDLINRMKFNRDRQIAECLGKLWVENFKLINDGVVLVPMPMHKRKRRERGFNQAEIMAMQLSMRLGAPVANTLVRIVDTPPQSGLNPHERVENVAGVFATVASVEVANKKFIIVDDIYTTGASMNECARVLIEAGAAEVRGLTLAAARGKKD